MIKATQGWLFYILLQTIYSFNLPKLISTAKKFYFFISSFLFEVSGVTVVMLSLGISTDLS